MSHPLRGQAPHDLFEHLPAVLVALELVEAGAGGGQQDDVSGLRDGVRFADGIFEGLGVDDFCVLSLCDSILAAAAPMV